MQTGRPSKRQRAPLGERIAALREQVGLSQQQLAEQLGVSQQMVAYWERRAATLRPDQLTALADALNISLDQLLGKAAPKARGTGPSGKMRQTFEAVSQLPRKQQQKVIEMAEGFLALHQSKSNGRLAAK